MSVKLKIFSSILLFTISVTLVRSQSQCETTKYKGRNGFCTIDPNCCKGITIDNLCTDGDVCCYGNYDCSSSITNPDSQVFPHCPPIVPRNSWKANQPKTQMARTPAVDHILVHHTDDGNSCYSDVSCKVRLRSLQSYHQYNKGWSDIAWNFLIGGNGDIYEGIGWNLEGFHTLDWNAKSLGIAFIGNFDEEVPREAMLLSLESLIKCGVSRGFIRNTYRIHGHKDVRQTSCPGIHLYQLLRKFDRFQSGPLRQRLRSDRRSIWQRH